MKNFFAELVTNRFGIVLATINVCAMATIIQNPPIFRFTKSLALMINFPGAIAGLAPVAVLENFFSLNLIRYDPHDTLAVSAMTLGIVAQWLLIAYFAKHAAAFISQAMAARRS